MTEKTTKKKSTRARSTKKEQSKDQSKEQSKDRLYVIDTYFSLLALMPDREATPGYIKSYSLAGGFSEAKREILDVSRVASENDSNWMLKVIQGMSKDYHDLELVYKL